MTKVKSAALRSEDAIIDLLAAIFTYSAFPADFEGRAQANSGKTLDPFSLKCILWTHCFCRIFTFAKIVHAYNSNEKRD